VALGRPVVAGQVAVTVPLSSFEFLRWVALRRAKGGYCGARPPDPVALRRRRNFRFTQQLSTLNVEKSLILLRFRLDMRPYSN
jgi:hypothetical protein